MADASQKKKKKKKKGLASLSAELILEIASYFYDDYIYCKLTDNVFIAVSSDNNNNNSNNNNNNTNQTLAAPHRRATASAAPPPPTSARAFYHICPYAALAMTNRYLWTVIPRPLSRPIPLEVIEEAELFLRAGRWMTGNHWAREYGRTRGSEMVRWKRETGVRFGSRGGVEGYDGVGVEENEWMKGFVGMSL